MTHPLTPQELAEATGDYEAIGKAAPRPAERPRDGWPLLVAVVLGALVAICAMAGAGWFR